MNHESRTPFSAKPGSLFSPGNKVGYQKNSTKRPEGAKIRLVEFLVFYTAFARSKLLIITYQIITTTEFNQLSNDDDGDDVMGTYQ